MNKYFGINRSNIIFSQHIWSKICPALHQIYSSSIRSKIFVLYNNEQGKPLKGNIDFRKWLDTNPNESLVINVYRKSLTVLNSHTFEKRLIVYDYIHFFKSVPISFIKGIIDLSLRFNNCGMHTAMQLWICICFIFITIYIVCILALNLLWKMVHIKENLIYHLWCDLPDFK